MLHVDRQGGTWRLLGSVVFIHRQVSLNTQKWHNNQCNLFNSNLSPYIQNSVFADMLMMSNIFNVETGSHLFYPNMVVLPC